MRYFKSFFVFLALFMNFNISANAGVFSKIGNWFNTGWNDYGYNNGYYNPPHRRGFYNKGNFTGITPPVNIQQGDNDFYCPNNINRFNHFPNGSLPQMNVPSRGITDFRSDVGTGAKIYILD